MNMHSAPQKKWATCEDRKAVVLLIDDDAASVADTVRILGLGGYGCHCARQVNEAVELLSSISPDLIVADLALVGPGGRRLWDEIRRAVGYFDVPVMFLSRGQGPDIIHRHGECGGAYYLRKPFDVMVLLELVDKSLWSPLAAAR